MDLTISKETEMLSLYQKNEIVINTIFFLLIYTLYLHSINNLTIFDIIYTPLAFMICMSLTTLIVNYTFYLD